MSFIDQKSLVYLVDDEFAVRDAVTTFLQAYHLNIECFASAEEFLEHYNPEPTSCLILDVRMPTMTGLELQEELDKKNIEIPIIFISGHGDVPVSAQAFRGGAIDFLEKPFDFQVLLTRINEALEKDSQQRIIQEAKQTTLDRYANLTPREKEIMKLITNNHSSKEVAIKLGVSNRTVDTHRAHIMIKMDAKSLSELVTMAVTCELF